MANDEKGGLANLNNKQKLIAVGLVVVVLVLIWQVMSMMGGGSKEPAQPVVASAVPKPAPGAATAVSSAAPGAPANPVAQGAAPGGAPAAPIATGDGSTTLAQTNIMTLPNDKKVLENQQQEQKNFIDAVNKLQLLKVQREIAETNQAISSAKLATATADKGMSDLLTKPAQPNVPAGAYSSSLVSPVQSGGPTFPTQVPMPGATVAPKAPADTSYVVISVAMQFNKWTAVVGLQGKLYSVAVGDQLPDGSVVASINKSGVELVRDSQRRKVSIVSSI